MDQGSKSFLSGTLSTVDKNILGLIQSQYAELYGTYSELLRHLTKEWQAQSSYYTLLQSLTKKRGPYLTRWWPHPPSEEKDMLGPDIQDELESLKERKSNLKNAMSRFDKNWKSLYQSWIDSELKLRMARERHASSLNLFFKSILGESREMATQSSSGPWASQQSLICSYDVYLGISSQSKSFLLASVRDILDLIYPQSKETLHRALRSVYEKKISRLEKEKEVYHSLLANFQKDEKNGTFKLEATLGQILKENFESSSQPIVHDDPIEALSDEEPSYNVADMMTVPFDGDFETMSDFTNASFESKRSVTPYSFYSAAAALPESGSMSELDSHTENSSKHESRSSSSILKLLEGYRQKIQPAETVSVFSYLDLAWQQGLHSLLTQMQPSHSAPVSPIDFSSSSSYGLLDQAMRRVYRLESRLSSFETPFSMSFHFHVLRIGLLSKKTRLIFQYWKKALVILSSDSRLNVYYCQSSELEKLADGSCLARQEKLLDVLWRERQSFEPDESYDLARGGVQVKALPLELAFELQYPDTLFESSSHSEKCVQGLAMAMGGASDKHHLKWKSEHIDDLVDWVVALQNRIHVHANPSKELEETMSSDPMTDHHEPMQPENSNVDTMLETTKMDDKPWRISSIPLGEDAHDPWQS